MKRQKANKTQSWLAIANSLIFEGKGSPEVVKKVRMTDSNSSSLEQDEEELLLTQPPLLVQPQKPGCLHAKRAPFRFVLLFFSCVMTFGPFFYFDMPSVLQETFTAPLYPNITGNCTTVDGQPKVALNDSNGTHCKSGLGLNDTEFNLMYSLVYWTNALFLIFGGFLVDKMGTTAGSLLYSSLTLAGSITFSFALHLKGTNALFPVLLLGRMLFGIGLGPLLIAQSRTFATWFKGRELAFAFGCTQLVSGSVMNFLFTNSLEEKYGIQSTFIGASFVCGIAFVCTGVTCAMDVRGQKQLGETSERTAAKAMKFTDLKQLSSSFWLLTVCDIFFFNGIYPFLADASAFVKANYASTFHFNTQESSYIAGSIVYVPMIFAPLFGILLDSFGRRGVMCLACALSTLPVYGLLTFSIDVHPLVPLIWLGLNYSMASAAFWPSFPLLVSDATLGTALGLAASLKMLSSGLTNLVVGRLLDVIHSEKNWTYVMLFLLANTLVCVVCGVLLNVSDYRKGGVLNAPPKPPNNVDTIVLEPIVNRTSSFEVT